MSKWIVGTGVVRDIFVQGPPGGPTRSWTGIIVDLDSGERISAYLEPKDVNRVVVGDYVQLEYHPGQKASIGFFGPKGKCRNLKVLSI